MPTRLLLDGDDLASLMHRVRAEMGPDAVVVRAERVRTGGVAGFFAKEHYELTVEVPDRPSRLARRPIPRPLPTPATGLAGLLDAADAEEAAGAGHPIVPATAGPHVSTDADTFASVLASIDDMADVAAASSALELPTPRLGGAAGSPAELAGFVAGFPGVLTEPRGVGGDRRALLGLGVPVALLGTGPLGEHVPLSDLLARLVAPPEPLRAPGSIIAVVGEPAAALAVATQLAVRIGQDPHDVVLAGQMHAVAGHAHRLLSASAAALHRTRCANGERVSVVAIGVGPQLADRSVAADLVADLGPDQAWAVMDARRKTSDLRAWLREVGRAREFDVAAAAPVHETQEPGTVLDLAVPIGWIDGLPATPAVWAAVLSERLAMRSAATTG